MTERSCGRLLVRARPLAVGGRWVASVPVRRSWLHCGARGGRSRGGCADQPEDVGEQQPIAAHNSALLASSNPERGSHGTSATMSSVGMAQPDLSHLALPRAQTPLHARRRCSPRGRAGRLRGAHCRSCRRRGWAQFDGDPLLLLAAAARLIARAGGPADRSHRSGSLRVQLKKASRFMAVRGASGTVASDSRLNQRASSISAAAVTTSMWDTRKTSQST